MKRTKKTVLLLAFLIIAACSISVIISTYGLVITRYQVVTNDLESAVHIVHLSDLHNSVFGDHNRRLIKRVSESNPDLILITGDLLNYNEERTDIAIDLIENLSSIAPVFVSYGNHESEYEKRYGVDLYSQYSEAGAVVLEREWKDLVVNGQSLRIGGIYGYCLPESISEGSESRKEENSFLNAFQDTENYTILMCHMPLCWIRTGSLDSWNVDCVLCGHVHGGQIRLPWIGGLWAPDQGWFPGREAGLYWSNDNLKVMVLTRGLGNTEKVPRFNNIPEILLLDLLPESGG